VDRRPRVCLVVARPLVCIAECADPAVVISVALTTLRTILPVRPRPRPRPRLRFTAAAAASASRCACATVVNHVRCHVTPPTPHSFIHTHYLFPVLIELVVHAPLPLQSLVLDVYPIWHIHNDLYI
jgi:hypothetical protein